MRPWRSPKVRRLPDTPSSGGWDPAGWVRSIWPSTRDCPARTRSRSCKAEVSADSEYRERFHREADTAATLWHPHIVAVHDRGESDGQLWIDMDYVDGTDAGELLEDRYPNGMPGRRSRRNHHRGRRGARLRPPEQAAAPRRQARQHPDRPTGFTGSANPVGRLRDRRSGRGIDAD